MRLRWLWFDYVPPVLGLSREERRAVRRRASALRRSDDRGEPLLHQLSAAVVGICVVLVILLSLPVPRRGMLAGLEWERLVTAIVLILGAWLLFAYTYGRSHTRFLCRALRERGHDVCPECSYLLRGLDETIERCSECGWLREKVPDAA